MICMIPIINVTAGNEKKFTVVLDAGHGGHDPGAIGRRGKEKNINLSVALKLGRLIEDNCPDTKVVYTRKKDVFLPLHKRAEIANNAKANLFISIHTNAIAARNSHIRGTETYTLGLHKTQENLEVAKKENAVILIEDDYKQRYAGFNPNSSESYIIFEFMQDKNMAQSVDFATLIQRHFKRCNRVDKGVHQAGFLVLRETSMPSVLIELGYISNPSEETYLLSDNGSSNLANAIYNAFLNYKSKNGYENINISENIVDETNIVINETNDNRIEDIENVECNNNDNNESLITATQNKSPVFKIQIMTSDKKLSSRSKLFKGLFPVDCYKEKGLYKYTYAEDTNYNNVLRIKRTKVDRKFKDAFIIAFKNGEKMDINQAIREFKRNR
ncbi:MAG: N-acetylmuramoyl-L-alanine amidase [Phocaeicola sp.]|nr:N-acetylmuramoyl-L-alanine amidase [Phocaeicola sp.]